MTGPIDPNEAEADLVADLITAIEEACGEQIISHADPATNYGSGLMPRRDGTGDVRLTWLSWSDGRIAAIDDTATAWFQHADGFVTAFRSGDCILAEQGPLGVRSP